MSPCKKRNSSIEQDIAHVKTLRTHQSLKVHLWKRVPHLPSQDARFKYLVKHWMIFTCSHNLNHKLEPPADHEDTLELLEPGPCTENNQFSFISSIYFPK